MYILVLLNGLQGQGIIVDHNSVELFDSIPQQYKDAAAQLHMILWIVRLEEISTNI